MPSPLKVFFSYSHQDEFLLKELRNHLSGLEKAGLLKLWYDRQIPKGSDWDEQIKNNLESADLILLLISSDFIASKYCMELETKRAIERTNDGSATTIPIFLRECSIDDLSINKLQGTPKDRKWVHSQENRDGAWTEVVEDIRAAAHKHLGLNENISEPSPPLPPRTQGSSKKTVSSKVLRILSFSFLTVVVVISSWFWFHPTDINTLNSRSTLSQGEYEMAREKCLEAPWSLFRKNCLKITQIALSKPESRDLFFRSLKENASEYAWMLMGDYRVSDYDGNNYETLNRAYSDYETAMRLNPKLPQVYFGRGVIHHFKNRPLEAIPEYETALKFAENNRRYTLNLAAAWADSGLHKRAIPLLYKIINEEGGILMAYAELVESLLIEKNLVEARRIAFRAKLLIEEEPKLKNKPLNKAEWFVMQEGRPAFLQKWPEKLFYLNLIFEKTTQIKSSS